MQLTRFFALLSISFFGLQGASPGGGSERMLNNEGLVVLARAGYNERFLAELIHSQPHRFDTSVEGLVYLAKQGISERIVRLVIAEQKVAERVEAERADEPVMTPSGAGPAPASTAPVRLKMIKQRVLVPVVVSQNPALGANPMIVVEKRLFGDRYYMLPGVQAPLAYPVQAPLTHQASGAAGNGTQVAAFR